MAAGSTFTLCLTRQVSRPLSLRQLRRLQAAVPRSTLLSCLAAWLPSPACCPPLGGSRGMLEMAADCAEIVLPCC